jgi:hypothetical protein
MAWHGTGAIIQFNPIMHKARTNIIINIINIIIPQA